MHVLQKNSFWQPRVLTFLKVENYFNSTTLLFTCRRNILSDSNNGKASLFIVNLSLILRKALENIITTLCKPFPLICKQDIPFFEVFPNFSYGKIALKSSPSFCPLWGNFTCFFILRCLVEHHVVDLNRWNFVQFSSLVTRTHPRLISINRRGQFPFKFARAKWQCLVNCRARFATNCLLAWENEWFSGSSE